MRNRSSERERKKRTGSPQTIYGQRNALPKSFERQLEIRSMTTSSNSEFLWNLGLEGQNLVVKVQDLGLEGNNL